MIKKLKIELLVLTSLLLGVFVSYNLDLGLYVYFNEFKQETKGGYLKDFFVNITVLGDSFWYFVFCFLGIVFLIIIEKTKIIKFDGINNYKNLFYYTAINLFFCGLLTQILKHIVGRARPNHTNINNSFGFDFFTLDSNFHSFPSGHTSTIFIIALIFSMVLPKLKYFLLFYASLVAFSRVVVGAHFLTDVIGGVILALLSFKIINIFFEIKLETIKSKIISQINHSYFFLSFVVLLMLCITLTLGPSLDLYLSSLFYLDNGRFALQSYYIFTILFREILLPITLIYILLLPVLSKIVPIGSLYFNYNFSVKDIFYIWSAIFINLIIFINLFFKTFWGRARPNEIVEFGGEKIFSSWYQISDSCNSNCSFVSGDAAVGFSLIVLYFVTNNIKYLYLSIIFGSLLGLVRIAEGGHFLSDVIFSGLFVFVLSFTIKNKLFNRV